MADAIEFVSGLHVKAPNPKAPDFVKASISIKVADLGLWLREKHKSGEEWVNIDVKESRGQKWYCSVSTFKPKQEEAAPAAPQKPKNTFEDMDSDIPFANPYRGKLALFI